MTYKDSQYLSDMADRDELRRELENDAMQETCDTKINDLMQDHNFFAQFIKDSAGEEWLDELLNQFVGIKKSGSITIYVGLNIGNRFIEYAEQWIKEGE